MMMISHAIVEWIFHRRLDILKVSARFLVYSFLFLTSDVSVLNSNHSKGGV